MGSVDCIIIESLGGTYKSGIQAIPLKNTDNESATVSYVRKDVELIQHYIKQDKSKQLIFSLQDSPNFRKARQYYINHITEIFLECDKSGGMFA